MPKIIKKFIFTLCLAILILPSFCLAAAPPVIKNPFDTMQIPIPGMESFQEANVKADGSFQSNWIADYIVGIYRYGIGIIAIIAMFAIAVGGTLWIISAGNPGKVNDAKSWISGGIIGLALGLGSYAILAMVNYNLVNFEPLGVRQIDEDDDSLPSANGHAYFSTPNDLSVIANYLKKFKVYCPVMDEDLLNADFATKISKINAISESFTPSPASRMKDIKKKINVPTEYGPMIYRYGSKNALGTDTKTGQACPKTQVCYDCSGYASQILVCAGLKKLDNSTDSIFAAGANTIASFKKIGSKDINQSCKSATNELKIIINNKLEFVTLTPGDVIGWKGHALIYTGNGNLDDSSASGNDGDGRTDNSYRRRPVCEFIKKYLNKGKLLYIRRVTVDNN